MNILEMTENELYEAGLKNRTKTPCRSNRYQIQTPL